MNELLKAAEVQKGIDGFNRQFPFVRFMWYYNIVHEWKAEVMVQEEKKRIKISVRNLVEFVLRSGDIDNRRTAGADKEAMQEGSRLHRKIQKKMGVDYRAEVPLKTVVEDDEFSLVIEGRADGVIVNDEGTVIDEIKCVYMDLHYLNEAVQIHLSQAMCYGYIVSQDQSLNKIGLQLTYCNIETEEIKRFQVEKTFEELEYWFGCLVHEYMKWARFQYHHSLRRDDSIHHVEFPFPYREGQRDLVVAVYRAISRKRSLFIQAPTGIGKTLSTIFPSVKAMGEGLGDKLFYLTAKTITRGVAEEAFALLRGQNLYFSTVTITAKEKLCLCSGNFAYSTTQKGKPECNPDACPYAKGHYDRVNDAVYDMIHKEFGITREVILDYAVRHLVCPFELCLDVSNWVDGIICDYNYVFDPNVRLKRYFSEGVPGEYLFLVDEAHNLVSRAREMFSAQIIKEDFLLMKRLLKERSSKLGRLLDYCNKSLLELKRDREGSASDFKHSESSEEYRVLPDVNHFVSALMNLFGELEKFMEENREFEDRDLVLDFYFTVRNFLNIYELADAHYRIYTQILGDGSFMVRLLCVNPSKNLKVCLDKGNSTIFFSATLLPILYYKELLSGNKEDYAIYAASPFSRENRLLLVASDVSSKYTRRNHSEYKKIVSYIRQAAKAKRGNYMVFLPSYQFMEAVRQVMEEIPRLSSEFDYLVQSSHMSEGERENFLLEFERDREKSLVALCVMGGVFSEGIDLKEEKLIGVIIVGTGLPMVCIEQEILKGYFDEHESSGFDYAYQYPGMNKVMQAAGRVIRTMQDRGVILLLDERFLKSDYQSLFPLEWNDFIITSQRKADDQLMGFWKGLEEKL